MTTPKNMRYRVAELEENTIVFLPLGDYCLSYLHHRTEAEDMLNWRAEQGGGLVGASGAYRAIVSAEGIYARLRIYHMGKCVYDHNFGSVHDAQADAEAQIARMSRDG